MLIYQSFSSTDSSDDDDLAEESTDDEDDEDGMSITFQRPTLLQLLQDILHDYPDDSQIFKVSSNGFYDLSN